MFSAEILLKQQIPPLPLRLRSGSGRDDRLLQRTYVTPHWQLALASGVHLCRATAAACSAVLLKGNTGGYNRATLVAWSQAVHRAGWPGAEQCVDSRIRSLRDVVLHELLSIPALPLRDSHTKGTTHRMTLLLLQMSIVLLVTVTCGWLARKLGQPRVIGEIVGGIFLGPSVLGRLSPHLAHLFTPHSFANFENLSTLGTDPLSVFDRHGAGLRAALSQP